MYARDRVLPQFFLLEMPITHSAYVAILLTLVLSLVVYVASGLSLSTISSMFSFAFLGVMLLVCAFSSNLALSPVHGILSSLSSLTFC
jgi:hypothetical protein